MGSGMSQAAWCRENNINLRTFNYWYVKFKNASKQDSTKTSWLSIKVDELGKRENISSTIRIRIGNAVIEIIPGFDSDHLVKVVKVLNSVC
jgi:hypothetical protein